jgi:hypothetical protein
MPSYDYIESATGKTVEMIVPIALRDAVPGHQRVAVPPRVNTVGFAPDIHSQAFGVREGLKDMETRYGADRIRRETGLTPRDLANAWSD